MCCTNSYPIALYLYALVCVLPTWWIKIYKRDLCKTVHNTLCPFFFSPVNILSSTISFPHTVISDSSMRSCPLSMGYSIRYGWLQQRRSSAMELCNCMLTRAVTGSLLLSSLLKTHIHTPSYSVDITFQKVYSWYKIHQPIFTAWRCA